MNCPPNIKAKKEASKIIDFIKKTFSDTGKNQALVALSGGIDSAVVFSLTNLALGPKNVFALFLPSKITSGNHLKNVKQLLTISKTPQENFTIINIKGVLQKSWRAIKLNSSFHQQLIKNKLQKNPDKQTRQKLNALNQLRLANLSARIRMAIIYDQAKLLDALVVGTENYSEQVLGYFTRFGDSASDLEPVQHLYKTQIYSLAKFLKIPESIVNQPPTAGLWKNQTDEQELGFSYQKADPIIFLYQKKYSQKQIVNKGYKISLVKKVIAFIEKNRFKQQTPYTRQ